jgi:hypothetical protein
VRGDVRDGPGLARSVSGMPWCSTQVSGRAHCMAARRTSLGHLDLATHPSAGMLDRLTRSWVLWLSRLEKVKNVLCARCRPKSKKMVTRVGEGPTAADRHQARVSDLREDHGRDLLSLASTRDPTIAMCPSRASSARPLSCTAQRGAQVRFCCTPPAVSAKRDRACRRGRP